MVCIFVNQAASMDDISIHKWVILHVQLELAGFLCWLPS